MVKITFEDNVTKANANTFNTLQDNVENAINDINTELTVDDHHSGETGMVTLGSMWGTVDFNDFTRYGNICTWSFRGQLNSSINGNSTIATLPYACGGYYGPVFYPAVGDRYSGSSTTFKWAYADGRSVVASGTGNTYQSGS